MFHIKVCGVTRVEDALAACDAGADAIGLNFYNRSPRSVSAEKAHEIADAVGGRALLIGVFVNAPPNEINDLTAIVPLDAIQLHGDEPVEILAALPESVPVVRAMRMGANGLAPVVEQAEAARRAGRPLGAVLVDAAVPKTAEGETVYGGSGHTTDWDRVRRERGKLGATPLILAGGLKPTNVARAITDSGADGVDTASGVESAPGVKDKRLIDEFVAEASRAFSAQSG